MSSQNLAFRQSAEKYLGSTKDMTVYIVRHGESEGNAGRVHSDHDTPLTRAGVAQAQAVARRLQHLRIDRIVSSTTKRTRQTSAEILALNPAPITYDSNFCEQSRPSEIRGLSHSDPRSKKVMKKILAHIDDPDWHYSDEENNFDFVRKIERALRSLEQFHEDENVVLVAHGHVLRAILGIVLLGNDFSIHLFELFTTGKVITKNTGVTIIEFSPTNGWQLVTFNDHAHLLE